VNIRARVGRLARVRRRCRWQAPIVDLVGDEPTPAEAQELAAIRRAAIAAGWEATHGPYVIVCCGGASESELVEVLA